MGLLRSNKVSLKLAKRLFLIVCEIRFIPLPESGSIPNVPNITPEYVVLGTNGIASFLNLIPKCCVAVLANELINVNAPLPALAPTKGSASVLGADACNPACLTINNNPLGEAIHFPIRNVSNIARSVEPTVPPLINPSSKLFLKPQLCGS